MRLGELLADKFTVYIVDRRGRGLSRAHVGDAGLKEESEDLRAVVNKTKAKNIYGLSAVTFAVLQTAIVEQTIHKIVFHEPPILAKETKIITALKKYNAAMANRNYGRAFLSTINMADDPSSMFNILPRFITAPLMNIAIRKEVKKMSENSDDMSLKDLIERTPYDFKLVEDSEGLIEKSKAITADILSISGQKSQPYLRRVVEELITALPKAKHTEIAGQGHTVSDNGVNPELVADLLRQFFGKMKAERRRHDEK